MTTSREGDFPYLVWQAIIDRGVCAECDGEFDPNDPWQVHHIIFLASETAKQFPLALLRSMANGDLLHRSCHHHIHNVYDEPAPRDVERVVREYKKQQESARRMMQRYNDRARRIS